MKLGRFAALESDVPDSPVLDADDLDESGAPVDASNTVEAVAIDAAEVEQPVIEEANEELETLDDSAESLEAYLDFIQEAKQNGGMDKNTAKAVKIGLDSALRSVGTNAENFLGMSQASLESFGTNRRLNQTISLENAVTEALRSVWEAIKRGINKLVTYVRDWWLKNFDIATRIKKRAEKLKEKASNTTGTAKETKIQVPNISQLHISKKSPTAKEIVESINKVMGPFEDFSTGKISSSFPDMMDSMVDEAEKGIVSIENKNDVSQFPDFVVQSLVAGLLENLTKGLASDPAYALARDSFEGHATRFSSYGEYSVYVGRSHQLCGGKAMFGFGKTGMDALVKNVDKSKPAEVLAASEKLARFVFLDIRDYSEKKVEVDSNTNGPTLKTSEVTEICSAVIDAMESIMAYKAAYGKYEKVTKDTIKKLDKLTNNNKLDSDNPDKAKCVRTVAKNASSLIKSVTHSINSTMGYLVTTSRAALNYCNSSLAQYKN
jgi:hypothetical protein